MVPLIGFIVLVIDLYIWVVIASAILSWLAAFNVVNTNNRAVLVIGDTLYRLTEPALRPIRSILPNLGGIDISPVILILLLLFIRDVVLLGPLPTPGVAYLTRALRLTAGIVISASHNPYDDNGIKFFSGAGTKLHDEVELAIEQGMAAPLGCVRRAAR